MRGTPKDGSLIVFAKAPVPGQVKTRLIPRLGAEGAAELARCMARDTVRVARAAFGDRVSVCYDPAPSHPTPRWISEDKSLPWFSQGPGDLGQRLTRVFASHDSRHGPLIVIGCDLPGLTVELLRDAERCLHERPVVLGPAEDGGYYLIGLRAPIAGLFDDVPWSTNGVLPETIARLAARKTAYDLLPVQRDIDRPEDLDALKSLAPSPLFSETSAWLETIAC